MTGAARGASYEPVPFGKTLPWLMRSATESIAAASFVEGWVSASLSIAVEVEALRNRVQELESLIVEGARGRVRKEDDVKKGERSMEIDEGMVLTIEELGKKFVVTGIAGDYASDYSGRRFYHRIDLMMLVPLRERLESEAD